MSDPQIEYLTLDDRFVLLSDGRTLPITNMLDDDGDECEPDDAVAIVAGAGETWLSIDLRELYHGALH